MLCGKGAEPLFVRLMPLLRQRPDGAFVRQGLGPRAESLKLDPLYIVQRVYIQTA